MKRRLLATLLLITSPWVRAQGPADPAQPPDAPAIATPATATEAVATLERGRQALRGDDYVGAGEAMDAIFRMHDFAGLDARVQYRTFLFAALAASGRSDLLSAHEWMVAATSYDEAGAGQWFLRARYADMEDELPDAALALGTLATRWPQSLVANPDHRKLVDQVVFQLRRDPRHHAEYVALANALFGAKYTRDLDLQPDGIWSDLILEALAHADPARARELTARVESTMTILAMRVDKRFDALVQADRQRFDLRAAMRRNTQRLAQRVADEPRRLAAVVEYANALHDQGRFREMLAVCDAALKKVAAGGTAPAYEDLDLSINWLYNDKARALDGLGRWDDAIAAMEAGRAQSEQGSENVSQAINLGAQYNNAGKPRQALAALARIDWTHDLSPYGRMQLEAVRYGAYLLLGDQAAADEVLAYLREHHQDAEDTWQGAMLLSGDEDGAAAALIERLHDAVLRGDALVLVQQYPSTPRTKRMQEDHDRWRRLLARADVLAAVDAVGRIEKVPVQE